uniref:Uncharacterized protein n=1 Tax=Romanomermis culicivorax TaxID=13658 RepID=A0A915JXE8_ROMCU
MWKKRCVEKTKCRTMRGKDENSRIPSLYRQLVERVVRKQNRDAGGTIESEFRFVESNLMKPNQTIGSIDQRLTINWSSPKTDS